MITLTPSATTWMDFPWGKYAKDRRQQHPFHSIPLCFSAKGHTAARLHAAAAGGWWLLLEPLSGFLTSRDWGGVWVSLCTSLNWQLNAGRNQALAVQPMMLRVNLGFGSWGTKRKKWKRWLILSASGASSYWRGGCQNCSPGFKHLILQCESRLYPLFFFSYFNYRNSQNY